MHPTLALCGIHTFFSFRFVSLPDTFCKGGFRVWSIKTERNSYTRLPTEVQEVRVSSHSRCFWRKCYHQLPSTSTHTNALSSLNAGSDGAAVNQVVCEILMLSLVQIHRELYIFPSFSSHYLPYTSQTVFSRLLPGLLSHGSTCEGASHPPCNGFSIFSKCLLAVPIHKVLRCWYTVQKCWSVSHMKTQSYSVSKSISSHSQWLYLGLEWQGI